MATSGNTLAQVSRDNIINSALRKLGVIGEGQTGSVDQITAAAEALNLIVSEFRTFGMSVWARETISIPTVSGQGTYVLGVGQAINTPYPTYIYSIQLIQPPFVSQIDMMQRAIVDFNLLPIGARGVPVAYTYQPMVNVGELKIWPIPNNSVPAGTYMFVTYQRPFEVFDAAANTPDFPQEWGNALIFQLALSLSDEYGAPEQKKVWLEKQADKHLATALSNSTEQGSFFMQKDWEGGARGLQ